MCKYNSFRRRKSFVFSLLKKKEIKKTNRTHSLKRAYRLHQGKASRDSTRSVHPRLRGMIVWQQRGVWGEGKAIASTAERVGDGSMAQQDPCRGLKPMLSGWVRG